MIPNLHQREFAFRGVDPNDPGKRIMARHYYFETDAEVWQYYTEMKNFDEVFYSAAYYTYPDAWPMKNKKWLGCDLAIDIDVGMDHRMNKTKFMAARAYKLLYTLFGLKQIQIIYTGNRGFHVVARDECIRSLSGSHRKEIAECLEFKGLVDLDYNVITDVKRLLRYPGSTHHKTGQLVRIVPYKDLEMFEP